MYPSIGKQTFDQHIDLMLVNIHGCFAAIVDHRSDVDDELKGWIQLIRSCDDFVLDDPFEIIKKMLASSGVLLPDEKVGKVKGGAAIVALTHLLRAKSAKDAGDDGAAWSYVSACSYWTGVAVSGKGLDGVQKSERKNQAAMAARAKGEKYGPLKEYARKMAIEKIGPSKKWPSVRRASEMIAAEVEAHRVHIGKPVPPITQKTLEVWLSRIPEAADVFGTSQKK